MKESTPFTPAQKETCKNCHECCRHLGILIPIEHTTSVMLEWLEARGFYLKAKFNSTALIWADLVCPHLKESGCDIYEERPTVCRYYDGRDDPFVMCPLNESINKSLNVKGGM